MATVITFLASSPAAGRRALRKIQKWITAPSLGPQAHKTTTKIDLISFNEQGSAGDSRDIMSGTFLQSNPLLNFLAPEGTTIDSQALPLPNDSLLHCLSLNTTTSRGAEKNFEEEREADADTDDSNKSSALILFAIQSLAAHVPIDCSGAGNRSNLLLEEARNRLAVELQAQARHATKVSHSISSLRILLSAWTGRGRSSDLLQHKLPILDLAALGNDDRPTDFDGNRIDKTWNQPGALKEIVVPAYPSDTYPDGRSIFTALQQSPHVHRPIPGLYQLPQGLCIRPLPAAKEDRTLPPPSLVFHTESLLQTNRDPETTAFKIGFTGIGTTGQLMLRDKSKSNNANSSNKCCIGVDVRLCAATRPTSMFSEAQESLLASSLHELQSVHVLNPMPRKVEESAKTSSQQQGEPSPMTEETLAQRADDPNTNKIDCWVEFRANLKNLKGFRPRN